MRRAVRALCIAVAATATMATWLAAPSLSPAGASTATATSRSQEWGAAEEQGFVDKINQLRASLGLPTLAVDPELAAQARVWSQTMKDAGNIFHSKALDAGISADWEKLGENVGVGDTVDVLFDAFVNSPKHYENLVDPSFRFIGVGVVWDGGRMFTAHRFMALMPPAPAPTATNSRPSATPAPLHRGASPDELRPSPPAAEPPASPPPPTVPRRRRNGWRSSSTRSTTSLTERLTPRRRQPTTLPAIVCDGITRSFDDGIAVDHLSFEVPRGSVLAPSGTTAPARRRPSASSTASSGPTPAPAVCWASIRRPAGPTCAAAPVWSPRTRDWTTD